MGESVCALFAGEMLEHSLLHRKLGQRESILSEGYCKDEIGQGYLVEIGVEQGRWKY